jgi:hypothetical protein
MTKPPVPLAMADRLIAVLLALPKMGLDDLIVGAIYADPSGKVSAGKSYVIFGKTDNTVINLSAIASGTGGFVIIGENAGDAVPLAMADRLIAVLSVLPKMT